jgi:hypothetical protein
MLIISHSMPIKMKAESWNDRRVWRLAIFASLALHLLIAAFLMVVPPDPRPQPPNEEAISVELVPPPEAPAKEKNEPYPVLQPVIQFAEKDAGPKLSANGNSAKEPSEASAALQDTGKEDPAQPAAVTTAKASDEVPDLRAHEPTAPMPKDAAMAQQASKLRQAKILFSKRASGDPFATVAIAYAPRDVRVARLCATELKEQLLHASPPYFPEIVPFDRLKEGTVVQNLSTAFRSNWEWYNLGYRCEVDADATKIVSFALDIGKPLTPDEFKGRGLRSQ